jgi:hypothetical protein
MYCAKLAKINFAGTEAEWSALEKSPVWDKEMKEYELIFKTE